MNAMSDLKIFEQLFDYSRDKLATDLDEYAIELLRQ